MMDAYDISSSAMSAQRLRLDIISSNLANMNTTRQADGSLAPYHRRSVVFASTTSQGDFANSFSLKPGTTMDGSRQITFENGKPVLKASISNEPTMELNGVRVSQVIEDDKTPLRKVYDPGNPDADTTGYVSYPNINPVTEMVDMISATRAYEANVDAFQASKSMDKAALEI